MIYLRLFTKRRTMNLHHCICLKRPPEKPPCSPHSDEGPPKDQSTAAPEIATLSPMPLVGTLLYTVYRTFTFFLSLNLPIACGLYSSTKTLDSERSRDLPKAHILRVTTRTHLLSYVSGLIGSLNRQVSAIWKHAGWQDEELMLMAGHNRTLGGLFL